MISLGFEKNVRVSRYFFLKCYNENLILYKSLFFYFTLLQIWLEKVLPFEKLNLTENKIRIGILLLHVWRQEWTFDTKTLALSYQKQDK